MLPSPFPSRLWALLAVLLLAAAIPARAAEPAQPEIVPLAEADVTGMIAAMSALSELGTNFAAGAGNGAAPDRATLEANAEVRAILARNNFTPARFASVVQSVGMALAALQIDAARIEQSMQEQSGVMAQMKDYMTPAQMAQIEAQMDRARVQLAQLRDQPPGNIELVRRHSDELQRLMAGMSR